MIAFKIFNTNFNSILGQPIPVMTVRGSCPAPGTRIIISVRQDLSLRALRKAPRCHAKGFQWIAILSRRAELHPSQAPKFRHLSSTGVLASVEDFLEQPKEDRAVARLLILQKIKIAESINVEPYLLARFTAAPEEARYEILNSVAV